MAAYIGYMIKPPESLHDRLNRELWRYRLGGWKAWAVMLPLLALMVLFYIPEPREVAHLTGTVTGVTTLASEYGPKLRIGVDLDGTQIVARTPAKFIAPVDGDTICLRHTDGQWTGIQTYWQTDMRLCDGSVGTAPAD